jgi:5-methyltetrahydrofolate--homocysteine methyltransferase
MLIQVMLMKEFFAPLPLILDGATGTQLQKFGMPPGGCTERWILDNPEVIISIQRAYVEAGSGAVYAPTFGANRVALGKYGLGDSVREYCPRLVELSRRAVSGRALVGGDMSPTGLMPAPYGTSSPEELEDIFREQATALEEAGVDFFGLETQMYLEEARAAVAAVKSVSKKPILVSFTCTPTGKSLWGEDLVSVMEHLQGMGVDAFGINCCGDLDLLADILAEMKTHARLPLIAKPNAGIPDMIGGRTVYHMSPEDLAEYVPKFVANGAAILGGCCGTHEGHIAAIREALENM